MTRSMKRMLRAPMLAVILAAGPLLAPVLVPVLAPAQAVQPDEILPNAGLEKRARIISSEIRCPVCQGESIDDSTAPISRDLRLIIRERLVAGDSNDEVIDFIVDRYGEFVLFNPRAQGANLLLWLAGPFLLVVVAGSVAVALRRRAKADTGPVPGLSAAEEARLRQLMQEDQQS